MIIKTESKQTTITKKVSLTGVGLHTGQEVTINFLPAEINDGYKFRRLDLEGLPMINADANLVTNTQRGTCLEKNGVTIQTCEHVLAALVGLEIDNLIIELSTSEPPIMDGSSKYFIKALESAGIKQLEAFREVFVVKEVISYIDDKSGSEITIIPSDSYQITTMVDFGTKILGTQNATLQNLSNFKKEISDSRTFSFLHELESLLENGLIKGGDLNNAIVYVDKPISNETMKRLKKAFNKEAISVTSNGILDNLTLHHPNEAARHKLLDVIGDLGLIGAPIKGKIITNRPGHTANVQFARVLKKAYLMQKKSRNIPKYDPNIEPIYDVNQIQELLPHRFPFLMIDKIIEVSENHVVGVKNVTMNEHLFQGHFPGNPIFPGVLQVEAMAQTGGILALLLQEDQKGWDTYFLKINNTKFKGMVRPGDTLVFKLELMAPIKRGIVQMYGAAYVGGKLVSEGEFTAQIVQRK